MVAMDPTSKPADPVSEDSFTSHGEPARELGGDPACWAHLESNSVEPLDSGQLTRIEGLVGSDGETVIVCDVDGTVLAWRNGHADPLAWTAEQMIGGSFESIIPPALRQRTWDAFFRALRATTRPADGRRVTTTAITGEGTETAVTVRVHVLHGDGDTTPTLVVALVG